MRNRPHLDTDTLTSLYDEWLAGNGIGKADAIEHLCFNKDLTHSQRYWLMEFVEAWKEAQSREDAENE